MSQDAVRDFFAKVRADDALRAEFEDLIVDGAASADATVALAGRHGFAFGHDDLLTYSRTLTEDDLDAVTGGVGAPPVRVRFSA